MFDLFKSAYNKQKPDLSQVDTGMMIGLSRWLSNDPKNLDWLSKLIPYQFYISPKHYYYMLYFGIRKMQPPFLKTVKKPKKKEDAFYDKLKYLFGWSNRELEYNMPLLNFLSLRKEWARKVGLDR